MPHNIAIINGKPAIMFVSGVARKRLKYIEELTKRLTENPHTK